MAEEPILPVYIGWDSREDIAYQVCRSSLTRHATMALHTMKLNRYALEWPGYEGIYTRKWKWENGQRVDEADGKSFSTEFAFTRFLVPILSQYEGWALFFDCDFLWRDDVAKLFALRDERYAVQVVKHVHAPVETTKMDNCRQAAYPRKNWSSLILWNCSHAGNKALTRSEVNTRPGLWLHGFSWLKDEEIGELPIRWNWLEGISDPAIDPGAVHFTRGGPWFAGYEDVRFADEWRDYVR